jgi:thiol-disulfide isomerase/thioredoxin
LRVRAQRREGCTSGADARCPCAVVWLLTAQPLYESAATEALTPAAMETRVLTPEGGAWVVVLQAPWHAGCVHFAPAFAELAQKYGDAARFGTFDLARWPGLAPRYT